MTTYMKRGDLLPALPLKVTSDEFPGGVDLTTATEVRLLIADASTGSLIVNATMAGRPADGALSYDWQAGDTAVSGTYYVEVQATFAGKKRTFPTQAYGDLVIAADLGG